MKADPMSRLEELSEQELVRLVKEGDKDAFTALSGRYLKILSDRAGRYSRIAGVEVEDFLQEGLLALYRASQGYHPSGQAQFRTYAVVCINNSMSAAIKRHMKQLARKSPLPFEQLELPGAAGILERENTDYLAQQIKTKLSPFERQVLRLYLSGHSYKQIAHALGTSAKPVDNALQRVRRKLQRRL